MCTLYAVWVTSGLTAAADLTFNITYIAEANPFPPQGSNFSYADLWHEGGFVYVGSDRGYSAQGGAQGMSIFSISNAGIPTFLPPPTPPPPGYKATTYFGSELEDVEVWDGIGYFGSDVNGATGRTGVDIVNLAIPFDPIMLSRVDASHCVTGIGCAHGKVHTLSVQIFPNNDRYLYTSDNETDVVKIINVSDPSNPQIVKSLTLGAPSGVAAHEVVVRDDRLYVASKSSSTTTNGWFHIYDVSSPANPVLLKAVHSGARSHTAMPTWDANTLIVTEERPNGNVLIYDISMIDEPNDPDDPILLATLNRTNVGIEAHSPHHPHVHGNLLFITWYEAGLQVFNIFDPANPVHVGAFDTYPGTNTNYSGNWGVDVSIGLHRVLLSDRQRGLIVVNASGVVAPGDYDQSMLVDENDYMLWRSTFGSDTRSGGNHSAPVADGNRNGVVDAADYVVWRKHLGTTGPSGIGGGSLGGNAAVPEPSTILLLAASLGLLVACGRVRAD